MAELNMENSWIFIDDDSSCGSLTDSDQIDSETEAELYSKIHHESNLTSIDSENLADKDQGVLIYSPFTENANSEHIFLNQNVSSAKRKSTEMDARSDEKLSPAKKHKSNAMGQSLSLNSADLDDRNDFQQFRMNDFQSKSRIFNSLTEKKSNNRNNTVMSSDSDDDIWIEPHSDDKSDLKINLLKNSQTIFLSSSDSENESDISSPFVKRDSILKNLSMPNLKAKGNSKDLWHINYEDSNRSRKYSNRYHENLDITCSNCNKKGHTSRSCPSPKVTKCFVCGGNHTGYRCSNRMCSNCFTYGHDKKHCWRESYKGFCQICNMEGHAKGNCPDLWRRYHLSTGPKKIVKARQYTQDTNLYCWNCGRGGHFGSVCPISHSSRKTFNTWPCVVSYNNPKYLFKSRLFYYGKVSSLNAEKFNNNVSNISWASTENKSQLQFKNELDSSSGFKEENRVKKVKKQKSKRLDLTLNKAQCIVKERNFPRTPKNENTINCSFSPMKSEEEKIPPHVLERKQLNRFKKIFCKQVKKTGLQSHEVMSPHFVSKMLSEKPPVKPEHEVPDIVIKKVQKKFNKWRTRRIRTLKRRANLAKEREFTKS